MLLRRQTQSRPAIAKAATLKRDCHTHLAITYAHRSPLRHPVAKGNVVRELWNNVGGALDDLYSAAYPDRPDKLTWSQSEAPINSSDNYASAFVAILPASFVPIPSDY